MYKLKQVLTILIGAVLLNSAFGLVSPHLAEACGGFFCNNVTPVNQSAERILFAQHTDEGKLEMHIQIQYAGPPTDFGWILPTAPDVETTLSSEALFSALDRFFAPTFSINLQPGENCNVQFAPTVDSAEESGGGNGGVQVLSREAVGPYDRAILSATSIQDLRAWLDENEFQIPESFDEKLQPYLDAGAAFVVIKLLPGQDSGDIVPLRLTFSGMRPTIPIVPTSVAATPDMGIIVHMLAEHRAIPVNYSHVVINEAAIDWGNQGANYPDVVSQAADEAGGQAFVTDFAGPHDNQINNILTPYDEQTLALVSNATNAQELVNIIPDFTNPDFLRVASGHVMIPEDVMPRDFFGCPSCYGEDFPLDGTAVAEQLEREVNPAYDTLNELLNRLPYLSRLYTTMSAEEMTNDPIFSTNPDMEDVSNSHQANQVMMCDEDGRVLSSELILSDGRVLDEPIQRQDGEIVRGMDTPASERIERTFEAGQPEVLMAAEYPADNYPEMPVAGAETMAGAEVMAGTEVMAGEEVIAGEMSGTANVDSEDSGCQQKQSKNSWMLFFGLALALGTRRRMSA